MGQNASAMWRCITARSARVLILGLDAAGKTTILYRLKLGKIVTTISTVGFNVETVEHGNFNFTFWDTGGGDKIRPLFRHYHDGQDAVIFVLDSADRDRVEEAREFVYMTMQDEVLKDAALLVFANKQDLPGAMSKEEVIEHLRLRDLPHLTRTICCSLNDTTAYYEGLDWLAEVLTGAGSKGEKKKRKKTPSSTLSALQPDENSLKEYSGKRSLLWKQLRCCC